MEQLPLNKGIHHTARVFFVLLALSPCLVSPVLSAPEKFIPSSNSGMFAVEIINDDLVVTLKVKYQFVDGDPTKAIGYGKRAYEWPSVSEKRRFKDHFKRQIENAWSEKYELVGLCPHAGNDNSKAISGCAENKQIRLGVKVIVVEDQKNPDWTIIAQHYPVDAANISASVCSPGTSHFADTCVTNSKDDPFGTLLISNNHIRKIHAFEGPIESIQIDFSRNSATIENEIATIQSLYPILALLTESNTSWTANIYAFSNVDEGDSYTGNLDDPNPRPSISLARARADAVLTLMQSQKAATLLQGRRTDRSKFYKTVYSPFNDDTGYAGSYVQVRLANTLQFTIAHEAGHLFGLGDEYVADGDAVGGPVNDGSYAAMVAYWGYPIPTKSDSGSIMSRGNELSVHHYIPFLEAAAYLYSDYFWSIDDI